MTGVPVLGVLPYLEHALPDEDGAALITGPGDDGPTVAVIRYPTASNLDEFKAVESVARLRWAWKKQDIEDADLVILPGSKFVAGDLAWLQANGFVEVLRTRIKRGGRVLGICGGLQMLGEGLEDPANVDGRAAGLCLLPLRTQFASDKITRVTTARFMSLPDPWSALSGLAFRGYEIRHGRSAPAAPLAEAIAGGLGYVRGSVLGSYVHGMLEFPDIARALFGKKASPTLDETFESLADAIDAALDMRSLEGSLAPHVVRGGDRLGELSPRTSPMSRP